MAGKNTTHSVIGSPAHIHSVCACVSIFSPTQPSDLLFEAENVTASPCFTSSVYQLERMWRINPTVKTTVYAVLWWSNVDYFLFSVLVWSANTNSSSLSCVVNIDTHRRMGSTVTWPFSGAISSHSLSCLSAVLRVTTSTTCRVKTSSHSGAVRVVLVQRQYCLCLGRVRERSCTILLPPGHGSENLGPPLTCLEEEPSYGFLRFNSPFYLWSSRQRNNFCPTVLTVCLTVRWKWDRDRYKDCWAMFVCK